MRDFLVKLADQLDAKGEFDLSDQIDDLVSNAAKSKSPMKKLEDNVKEDILKFVCTVKDNVEDSIEALQELFRRLRYFDITDEVKDTGLEKMLKDLQNTHACADNAMRTVYTKTKGKKPSADDIEQMAEDFGREKTKFDPYDFFPGKEKEGVEAAKERPGELHGNSDDHKEHVDVEKDEFEDFMADEENDDEYFRSQFEAAELIRDIGKPDDDEDEEQEDW